MDFIIAVIFLFLDIFLFYNAFAKIEVSKGERSTFLKEVVFLSEASRLTLMPGIPLLFVIYFCTEML